MDNFKLTPDQEFIANEALDKSIFLHGNAGTGKTISAISRLQTLIKEYQGNQILVLVPQMTLGNGYLLSLSNNSTPYSHPTIVTLGGISRRIVQMFWPLIAGEYGFSEPQKKPTFLNLETAQYYLGKVLAPIYEQGYFRHVPLDKNRLVSQLLDNLNKAAITGLSSEMVMDKLSAAWAGKPDQLVTYQEAQLCINQFRLFCIKHQLLDYSLLIEVFHKACGKFPELNQYILSRFRHLIYDNTEEDVPAAHSFVWNILNDLDSSLLIYDNLGGFRSFLGADPTSANLLSERCDNAIEFHDVMNDSTNSRRFGTFISAWINKSKTTQKPTSRFPFEFSFHPFIPDSIQAVITRISDLVFQESAAPHEIVVLSPYLTDILMHQFQQGLKDLNIPHTVLRPSRAMIDNPTIKSLTTLATLANPMWNLFTNHYEIRNCLVNLINGFDPLRADILSRIIYPAGKQGTPGSYDKIANARTLERIPREFGEKFDMLRGWIEKYTNNENKSLVYFFRELFEDILYQPGYSFWENPGRVADYAKLVKSIENFYSIQVFANGSSPNDDQGKEYIELLRNGIIPAAYDYDNEEHAADSLVISPIHTFLMENRTVQYQFWFDVGSQGWWERLYQPLTHPVVLSRNWTHGNKWTDHDEVEYSRNMLSRITTALTSRCSKMACLYAIGRDEQGIDQKGPLLVAIQNALRNQQKGEISGAV